METDLFVIALLVVAVICVLLLCGKYHKDREDAYGRIEELEEALMQREGELRDASSVIDGYKGTNAGLGREIDALRARLSDAESELEKAKTAKPKSSAKKKTAEKK
jgi:regulator of replication initiation timing